MAHKNSRTIDLTEQKQHTLFFTVQTLGYLLELLKNNEYAIERIERCFDAIEKDFLDWKEVRERISAGDVDTMTAVNELFGDDDDE